MKAIFPDAKSLQPIPTPDVHPNISGNINGTTTISPQSANTENTLTTPNNGATNIQSNSTQNGNNLIFYFIGFIIILIIIFVYIRQRRKQVD